METKDVVLKSADPDSYSDLTISCKVIENDKINDYLRTIPEERKFKATKNAPVVAKSGNEGETVDTVLYTVVDGKKYIMSEESAVVGVRDMGNGTTANDVIVTNVNSTSNEQYIVKADKFVNMYTPNEDGTYTPVPDEREFAQVSENVIIKTAWGSDALCLNGSYIVTYDAASNDFNTVEKGAFDSTYSRSVEKSKGSL